MFDLLEVKFPLALLVWRKPTVDIGKGDIFLSFSSSTLDVAIFSLLEYSAKLKLNVSGATFLQYVFI